MKRRRRGQACDLRQYLQRDARAAVLVQRLTMARVIRVNTELE